MFLKYFNLRAFPLWHVLKFQITTSPGWVSTLLGLNLCGIKYLNSLSLKIFFKSVLPYLYVCREPLNTFSPLLNFLWSWRYIPTLKSGYLVLNGFSLSFFSIACFLNKDSNKNK